LDLRTPLRNRLSHVVPGVVLSCHEGHDQHRHAVARVIPGAGEVAREHRGGRRDDVRWDVRITRRDLNVPIRGRQPQVEADVHGVSASRDAPFSTPAARDLQAERLLSGIDPPHIRDPLIRGRLGFLRRRLREREAFENPDEPLSLGFKALLWRPDGVEHPAPAHDRAESQRLSGGLGESIGERRDDLIQNVAIATGIIGVIPDGSEGFVRLSAALLHVEDACGGEDSVQKRRQLPDTLRRRHRARQQKREDQHEALIRLAVSQDPAFIPGLHDPAVGMIN